MKINHDIAIPIVQKLMTMMNYNINIMDDRGIIVASTDENRIDSIHEGALKILQSKQPLIIYNEDTKLFSGTKAGVNLPIEFLGDILGVVGITGDPHELMQLTQMTKITVELMLQQEYMQKQTQFKQQLLYSWVMELISPDTLDEKRLRRHANHFLHIDLTKDCSVLLIELKDLECSSNLDDFIKKNEQKTAMLQRIKDMLPENTLLTLIEDSLVFIGLSLETIEVELEIAEKVHRLLNDKYKDAFLTHIGIGNRYKDIEGFRRSYMEARQSITLMNKFEKHAAISHIKEWGLIRIIDQLPSGIREELLTQYPVDKLPSDLIKTLEVLFENDHNLATTAKQLHIHRNTLTYRLECITQLTQLNPKSVKDSTILLILTILNNLEK
ncbi:CdaR family transcriptional regulator [Bacillus sp. Marseille-P3661]|uniref:CdaR family transcriptional regulator n=1 Tax=Bacillus sp. Marseille-P3661 TaxID=1936234 RepID=UPI000C81D7AF|nr:sugar diacid recognition domain-containing protein [Bacillus sp. Marseille-P3661]